MLYLDQIIEKSSGVITLTIPDVTGGSNWSTLTGYLSESPSISLQNTWGSLFPDMSTLADISSLAGSKNIISFLTASQAGWKGTEPLTIGVEFYMISYKKGTNIKAEVAKLAKMATLYSAEGDNLKGMTTVQVHGGYSNNYLNNNNQFIGSVEEALKSGTVAEKAGLIKMEIGGQLRLSSLLLSDIQITPSVIQVGTPSNNNTGIPLYIKVNANFRTYRTMLSSDIDYMYGI